MATHCQRHACMLARIACLPASAARMRTHWWHTRTSVAPTHNMRVQGEAAAAPAAAARRKRILSGVQPTGKLHLGNYLGAIKNWVGLQDTYGGCMHAARTGWCASSCLLHPCWKSPASPAGVPLACPHSPPPCPPLRRNLLLRGGPARHHRPPRPGGPQDLHPHHGRHVHGGGHRPGPLKHIRAGGRGCCCVAG